MRSLPPESAQELLEGLAAELGSVVQQTARRETIYGSSSQDVRVVGIDGDAADVVRPEDELCVAAQNLSTETAVPGVSQSDLAPVTDMTTVPAEVDMTIVVDGGVPTAVVFAWAGCVNGGLVAAEMQLKIQALGAEFAAVTVAYVGVAPDDYYHITSSTFGRESDVVVTNGAPNNCADDLKLGLTNGGIEWTGYEDYHIPITSDAAGPTAPRCSAFQFTVARDVTCSAIELMVRHDPIDYPEGAFWVALYSGATADALVQIGVFGSLEGARVPWSEYSLVYFGLIPGVAEVALVPGTNYWIGLCGGDPTDPAPPAAEQWNTAALWVMKSVDGAVGLCAFDTAGVHRPEDWGPGDFDDTRADIAPWFRLYQRKTVLRSVPASPHVVLPSPGEHAVMERVGGDHPHRQISGARGGLSSAGAYGRGASGAGSTGAGPGISSALPLVAGEVVYATGPSTVASDAGFTFDVGTGDVHAGGNIYADGGMARATGAGTYVEMAAGAADSLIRFRTVAGDVTRWEIRDDAGVFVINEGLDVNQRLNIAVGGASMAFSPDTDADATFGRVVIGHITGVADDASMAHFDHTGARTTVGFRQSSTGASIVNSRTGERLYLRIEGLSVLEIGGTAAAGFLDLTSGAHTVANDGEIAMFDAREALEWYIGSTRHTGGAMVDKDVGDDRITGAIVGETTLKSSNWQAALDVIGRTMVFDIRGIGYSQATGGGAPRVLTIRVKLDGNIILEIENTHAALADHAYSSWWARVTIDYTSTTQGWVSAMGAFTNPLAGGFPMQQGCKPIELWSDEAVVASDSPLIVTGTIAGGGGAASFLSCWKLNPAVEQI